MKLTLSDLAGAATMSVEFLKDGRVFSRELPQHHLEPRVDGRDWPWSGLTMGGLARLDDLQSCVETVVADGVEGDLIEAGTWRGGSSILMRATLDSLGAEERTVWVADSFQGFPGDADGAVTEALGAGEMTMLEFLAIPVEQVRASFELFGLGSGVRFVPGFFADTMPSLRGGRWSVVRLDADSYEATRDSLEALYPGLCRGGYLIIDDYGAIDACRRAVDDYRREHGIAEPLERIDWTGARWRREDDPEPPQTPEPDAAAPAGEESRPAASRPPGGRIPSLRELQLRAELAEATRETAGPRGERRSLRDLLRRGTKGGAGG